MRCPRLKLLWIPALLLYVLGCAHSGGDVPVAERGVSAGANPDYHTVSRGDTLYSIAWRYGMDYRRLAAANNIRAPYTISPGQRISLNYDEGNGGGQKAPSAGQQAATRTAPQTLSRPPSGSAKAAPDTSPKALSGPWLWPAKGKVLEHFSTWGRVNKGIDIGGHIGESVHSTRSGKVVYVGTGLAGYGNLVIVKHNEEYLSAYAHNRRILVREGDWVKAGQSIAEMGSSGNRAMLHFEIRQRGKPVNPEKLLSKR